MFARFSLNEGVHTLEYGSYLGSVFNPLHVADEHVWHTTLKEEHARKLLAKANSLLASAKDDHRLVFYTFEDYRWVPKTDEDYMAEKMASMIEESTDLQDTGRWRQMIDEAVTLHGHRERLYVHLWCNQRRDARPWVQKEVPSFQEFNCKYTWARRKHCKQAVLLRQTPQKPSEQRGSAFESRASGGTKSIGNGRKSGRSDVMRLVRHAKSIKKSLPAGHEGHAMIVDNFDLSCFALQQGSFRTGKRARSSDFVRAWMRAQNSFQFQGQRLADTMETRARSALTRAQVPESAVGDIRHLGSQLENMALVQSQCQFEADIESCVRQLHQAILAQPTGEQQQLAVFRARRELPVARSAARQELLLSLLRQYRPAHACAERRKSAEAVVGWLRELCRLFHARPGTEQVAALRHELASVRMSMDLMWSGGQSDVDWPLLRDKESKLWCSLRQHLPQVKVAGVRDLPSCAGLMMNSFEQVCDFIDAENWTGMRVNKNVLQAALFHQYVPDTSDATPTLGDFVASTPVPTECSLDLASLVADSLLLYRAHSIARSCLSVRQSPSTSLRSLRSALETKMAHDRACLFDKSCLCVAQSGDWFCRTHLHAIMSGGHVDPTAPEAHIELLEAACNALEGL